MQKSILMVVGLATVLVLGLALLLRTERHPNVILILADDMGYTDLGDFGGGNQTPNLDFLAAHGAVFTQFYNTSRCWTTRASLMTGLYPHQAHHAMQWGPQAPPAYQGTSRAVSLMIPEVLGAHGYATFHVGKWHLGNIPGNNPLERGFQKSYWTEEQDNYFNPPRLMDETKKIERPGQRGSFYTTDAIGDHASGYIRELRRTSSTPFFMYVAFTAPHFPLQAPKETIDRYFARASAGWDVERDRRFAALKAKGFDQCAELPRRDDLARAWDSLSPEEKDDQAWRMATYLAMIDHMDKAIGRIVEALRATGDLDNTAILFLADNGASAEQLVRGDGHDPEAAVGSEKTYRTLQVGWSNAANTPFRGHKISTYEGGIATPLVAFVPRMERAAGGRRIAEVSHVIDIVPTILELAGLPRDAMNEPGQQRVLPGRSLLPALAGAPSSEPRALFWEHVGNRAYRKGDWKIVADYEAPFELYDLSRDRCETHDLAREKPDIVKSLAAEWDREAAAQGVLPWSAFPDQRYVPSAAYRQK